MSDQKEYHRKWREKNREYVNAFSREYASKNSEQRKLTLMRSYENTKQRKSSFIKQIVRTAKQNALKKDLEFHLTYEIIKAWIEIQGDKCVLTDIPFSYECDSNFRNRPFTPSIDRIDNTKGYTFDNIQIVCNIVNKAKNEYPSDLFDQMCRARVRKLDDTSQD